MPGATAEASASVRCNYHLVYLLPLSNYEECDESDCKEGAGLTCTIVVISLKVKYSLFGRRQKAETGGWMELANYST